MIGLSMLGLRPSRAQVILLGAISLAIAAIGWRRNAKPLERRKTSLPIYLKIWTVLCLAAIAYAAAVEANQAFAEPTTEWDAFAIWQLKAKVLSDSALNPKPAYFSDLRLEYSHLRYPVLVPMISAALHALTGRTDDRLEKVPSLMLLAGLGLAVYAAVRRFTGPIAAITVTALLLNLPTFYRYGCSGTAETALTVFYGCSVICLLNWQRDGGWADLVLAALFSACAAWSKNEGLPLAGINALVVLGKPRARSWISILIFISIIGILIAPWFLYLRGLPPARDDYWRGMNGQNLTANLWRLPVILRAIGRQFIDWRQWGILWILTAGMGIVWLGRRRAEVGTLWALGVLQLMLYVLAYLATSWDIYELLPVTLDRLLLHVTPVAALAIGVMWKIDAAER